MTTPALSCRALTLTVPGRVLVRDLDLATRAGEMLCVLGVNGAGKTTLLHALAGLHTPAAGEVLLTGIPLATLGRRNQATRIGLLFQDQTDAFPATVMEQTLVGRHPHIGYLRWESGRDHDAALKALQAVDLAGMAEREVHTLSGGERRRLAAATLLAQDPLVFLVDEPVNHLDPGHQLRVLRVFRDLADRGRTVVVTLHDVNLAARFADRVLLLFGNGEWQYGAADEALNATNLERLYNVTVEAVPWGQRQLFVPCEKQPGPR